MFDRRMGELSDRRQKSIDFRRRTMDRRGKKFFYDRTIYLTDTNAFGNMYFAQYFDIIGEAREELLKYLLGDNLPAFFQTQINILTIDTAISYKKPFYLYDDIHIEVQAEKLKKLKVYLKFILYNKNTNKLHAEAKMTLGFMKDNKPIEVPELIGNGLKLFLKSGE